MAVPDVKLEVALGADFGVASSGWTWTEIGDRASRIRWTGPRRSTIAGQIQAGELEVELDNSDGLLDPRATSGAFTSGGVSLIRPRLPVWFQARYPAGSGSYTGLGMGYRSTGRIETRPPADSVAVWNCPDGLFRFDVDRAPVTAVGEGELTGARVSRVATSAGWLNAVTVDTGTTPLSATDLGGSALDELIKVAAAEQGDLLCDGNGGLRFIGRVARQFPGSVDYAFSDASSTMDPASIAVIDDDTTIVNRVVASRVDGSDIQVDDTSSQDKFGVVARSLPDLVAESDVWVQAIAEGIVYTYADWSPRIQSITLDPSVNDSLWSVVLGIKLGDYITVTENGTTRSCWVEGVDHDVTALRNSDRMRWVTTVWTTDFGTTRAYNVWDTAVWDTAVWAW